MSNIFDFSLKVERAEIRVLITESQLSFSQVNTALHSSLLPSPVLSSSATHQKNLNFRKFMRSFRMLRRRKQKIFEGYVYVMTGGGGERLCL